VGCLETSNPQVTKAVSAAPKVMSGSEPELLTSLLASTASNKPQFQETR